MVPRQFTLDELVQAFVERVNDIFSESHQAGGKKVRPWRETLRRQILLALDQADGSVSEAAKILGISRTTIYRELRGKRWKPRASC